MGYDELRKMHQKIYYETGSIEDKYEFVKACITYERDILPLDYEVRCSYYKNVIELIGEVPEKGFEEKFYQLKGKTYGVLGKWISTFYFNADGTNKCQEAIYNHMLACKNFEICLNILPNDENIMLSLAEEYYAVGKLYKCIENMEKFEEYCKIYNFCH